MLTVMRSILCIGLLAVATTACSLLPSGCPTALAQGRLGPDSEGGALLLGEFGEQRVQWPTGYAVEQKGGLRLWGPFGALVASEGETVYVGGGMSPDNKVFVACGYVSRDPP